MNKQDLKEKKRLEKITETIDRDVEAVIVEGFSDRRILRKLGFKGRIFESAEKSIEDLREDVARSVDSVAVLTDFDAHGKKQAKLITQALEKEIDVLRSLRRDFGSQMAENDRRAVEDIGPLFESKEKKFIDAALDRLFF